MPDCIHDGEKCLPLRKPSNHTQAGKKEMQERKVVDKKTQTKQQKKTKPQPTPTPQQLRGAIKKHLLIFALNKNYMSFDINSQYKPLQNYFFTVGSY